MAKTNASSAPMQVAEADKAPPSAEATALAAADPGLAEATLQDYQAQLSTTNAPSGAHLAAPAAKVTSAIDIPPPDNLFGGPGAGFCTGKAMYAGPTKGWEDCRAKCDIAWCNYWSYWHDAPG